jgi:hypothetical protein
MTYNARVSLRSSASPTQTVDYDIADSVLSLFRGFFSPGP